MSKKTDTKKRMAYQDEDLASIKKVSKKDLTKKQQERYNQTKW